MTKLILSLTLLALSAFAADPFEGTWTPTRLDQWKTSPGMPESAKTTVVIFSAKGKDTLHVTNRDATGKILLEGDWVLNGEESPAPRGGGKFSAKRIEANHIQTLNTTAKGTTAGDWVVSPDGKTLTRSRKGIGTASGRAVDEVYLYAKLP